MNNITDTRTVIRIREAGRMASDGGCLADLALLWKTSRPAVCRWLERNVCEDVRRQLIQNGRSKQGAYNPLLSTVDRLELIKTMRERGWSDARTARGIGIAASTLSKFVALHAPDSLEQAIEDLTDDEQSAA